MKFDTSKKRVAICSHGSLVLVQLVDIDINKLMLNVVVVILISSNNTIQQWEPRHVL